MVLTLIGILVISPILLLLALLVRLDSPGPILLPTGGSDRAVRNSLAINSVPCALMPM